MDLVSEIEMGKGEERLRILVFLPFLEKGLCPLHGGGCGRVGLQVNGEERRRNLMGKKKRRGMSG